MKSDVVATADSSSNSGNEDPMLPAVQRMSLHQRLAHLSGRQGDGGESSVQQAGPSRPRQQEEQPLTSSKKVSFTDESSSHLRMKNASLGCILTASFFLSPPGILESRRGE